jgi:hypothetical protein
MVKPDRLEYQIAQLRHAYKHLAAGRVINQREFADGLIAPAIQLLERMALDPRAATSIWAKSE